MVKGITFSDVIKKFGCSKEKAQLRLKNACKEKMLKMAKNPQFYLDWIMREQSHNNIFHCIRATIIENKRNRLIDPTGVTYSNKGHSSIIHYITQLSNRWYHTF